MGKRNSKWEKNVLNQVVPDTDVPTKFDKFCLFEEGVEAYAMAHTTLSSNNVQYASTLTEDGKVVTLECYENIAKVAQKIFDKSTVKNKIELVVGTAAVEMTNMVEKGDK